MDFRFLPPPHELKPYISAYLWYHIDQALHMPPFRFVPSGSPYLAFNLGDPVTISNRLYPDGIRKGTDLLIGQQESYFSLTPGKIYSHFCIIFQPSGLTRLMDVPIHELADDAVDLQDLLKGEVRRLIDRLHQDAITLSGLVREINAFFFQRLLYDKGEHSCVAYAIDHIRRKHGLVTVTELAGLANTCVRNFRRRFLETTGLSPKKYIMITRIKGIFSALEHNHPLQVKWSDITYRCGYYDQMHFIKEFKKFCGETPSAWMKKYNDSTQTGLQIVRFLLS